MHSNEFNEITEAIFQEGSILSFLNSLDKGLIIIDRNESIIFINDIAQKKISTNLVNVQQEKIYKIIPFKQIRDVLIDGLSFSCVKVVLRQEINHVNISPIEINRDIFGAVITIEDTDCKNSFINTLKLCKSISIELESVFNSFYDEFIITDGKGEILMVNNAVYEKFYNLKLDDFVGKNVAELEKIGTFTPSVILKVIKGKKRISLTQKTNSGRTLIVTGHPVFNESFNLVSVISMAKDITEIHQLKEKLEKVKKTAQKYYFQLELLRQKEDKEESIIYKSLKMKKVMSIVEKVAKIDLNVLISGESGVGKSMIAEIIHKKSNRRDKNFVSINCGAIPETLLESEFFGYEKGAFTGAKVEGKIGNLDLADKGTLFLDEISELPIHMQVKLLKVIQEKKFMRVGGTTSITSDFRLIVASNNDIKEMVKEGRFREDLFYRLNVIPLDIPPLRERKQDIVMLVNDFWDKLNKKYGTNRRIDKEAYDVLTNYYWPGNVRELENCLERIMITIDKDVIKIDDLPVYLMKQTIHKHRTDYQKVVPLKKAIEETERKLIMKAYEKYKNTYKMAEVLGISQPTVVRKLKKYKNLNDK